MTDGQKKFEINSEQISAEVEAAMGRMPAASAHFNPGTDTETGASENGGQQQQQRSAPADGPKDDTGEIWNPEIHATGADGFGIKTTRGTWRKRRKSTARTGKPETQQQQSHAAVPTIGPDGNPLPQPLTPQQIEQCKGVGLIIAMNEINMMQGIFGNDWKPTDGERTALVDAWQNYAIAKRWMELSPGWMLAGAHVAYMGTRVLNPGEETRSRWQKIKTGFGVVALRFRDRMRRRKDKQADKATSEVTIDGSVPDARADSRPNTAR